MHRLILIFPILLLCRCASKHQPLVNDPYFAAIPEEALSRSVLIEAQTLESQPEPLNAFQKKRLLDLYQIEKKHLKEPTPRARFLADQLDRLGAEIDPVFFSVPSEAVSEIEELRPEPKEKFKFDLSELKSSFQQAYEAWNKDENVTAINTLETVIRSESFEKKASPTDKNRILDLYFRAAFDSRNFEKCQTAYETIREESSCSKEAAQTGFLLALLKFAEGKRSEAHEMLKALCEPDQSAANKMRLSYWLFRTAEEQSSEQQKYFEELSAFPIPGYYMYLAERYRGRQMTLPQKSDFRFQNFSVSNQVNAWIVAAEDCIKYSLRKDAVRFLRAAQKELFSDPSKNNQALLYVGRLFQAAGNHLEAMKIINVLATDSTDSNLVSEFMNLYHRPFEKQVQWYGKTWGIDPDFIYSIMRQESAFNPGAVSVAGARGLMQLMPALAKFLMEQWRTPVPKSKGYLFQGEENIKIATYHLNQLNKIAPHPALIAASYNAGLNRVSSWWRRSGHYPLDVFVEFIPVNETRNYVKLVLRNYIYYKGLKQKGEVSDDLFTLVLPPL